MGDADGMAEDRGLRVPVVIEDGLQGIVDDPKLTPVVDEVDQRLRRVMASIG